ncbi:MAG: hypothetical protein Q8P42_05495 [Gallionella sp.]|nr:hypothetical protein [Gallionella sp.]
MNTDMPILDLPEALLFYECNPPVPGSKLYFVADLSAYKQATPEALEYLALKTRDSCDFVNFGLTNLDRDQAAAIIKWAAAICFVNLEKLDAKVAAILVAADQIMVLDKLNEIDPELAGVFAKLNGILDLTLESLSLEVANELIKHQHELFLTLKVSPSGELLSKLSKHEGYRLHVTWERQAGNSPCQFVLSTSKKVVIGSSFHADAGKWFEDLFIFDADIHSDERAHGEFVCNCPALLHLPGKL